MKPSENGDGWSWFKPGLYKLINRDLFINRSDDNSEHKIKIDDLIFVIKIINIGPEYCHILRIQCLIKEKIYYMRFSDGYCLKKL